MVNFKTTRRTPKRSLFQREIRDFETAVTPPALIRGGVLPRDRLKKTLFESPLPNIVIIVWVNVGDPTQRTPHRIEGTIKLRKNER